jgi:hypothetical protein
MAAKRAFWTLTMINAITGATTPVSIQDEGLER